MSELTREQLAYARAFVAEQRLLLTLLDEKFLKTVTAMASRARPPKDITAQASQMPRNSCLAYKNKRPKDGNSPSYLGVIKLENGELYWIGLWRRIVHGETVVEIRLTKKTE